MFLEECNYVIKEKTVYNYIIGDVEISSDSDEETMLEKTHRNKNSGEKKSGAENSDKENFDEENLNKKYNYEKCFKLFFVYIYKNSK